MFPNKILQKVSKAEILQNAQVGTAVHCLLIPFMGLASKLDFAKIAECSYTCCACYSASSAGSRHGDFLKWGPT